MLSSVLSNVLSLIVILVTLFYLSWLVSLIGLLLIPLFIFPARLLGRRLQRLSRESMQLNAEMGSTMTERFNVAGAMLAKLYGRPREESELFAAKAFKVREIGVTRDMYGMVFMIAITLLTGLFTAVTYGVGGALVIHGAFQFGTLVAIAQLLARVYGPIGSLSNVQIQVMTALVSFDRVFEVLDLEPLIKEKPGAVTLPARDAAGTAPSIAFDRVSFRYPTAQEVSLASLESIALKQPERTDAAAGVLHDISFTAPAGQAHRARRPVRRGQDHDHPAGLPDVRPERRRGAHRRPRHPRRHARLAARRGRRRHPGRAPVPRHDPHQPAVRAAGRDRAPSSSRRARPRRSGT